MADWQRVKSCQEDADKEIVKCTIEPSEHYDVIVVADNTDVVIMFLFHSKPLFHKVTFALERWQKSWKIRDAVSTLQYGLQSHIMVLYACTSCNITSVVYSRGKDVNFE